jgi:hypothetical protein
MRTPHRQRGWIGLVVLLLALVIVGVLGQTILRQMGLLSGDRMTTKTAGPRAPGAVGAAPIDATTSTPVPGNAVERARGLESSLQQQSQDLGQRIDAQAK